MRKSPYRLDPFEPLDFFLADLTENDMELRESKLAETFVTTFASGPGFTARYNDLILGSAGVAPVWNGVGEAWFLNTIHLKDHAIYTMKAIRRIIKSIYFLHNLERIQASVEEDFYEAHKLVEWLGFKHEGRMPHYGPDGSHFVRYAITAEDLPWQ